MSTASIFNGGTTRLDRSGVRPNPYKHLRRRALIPTGSAYGEIEVTNDIIESRGHKRTFKARGAKGKTIEAVRGIDLSVREGEIVGFLGPNGAGKTTTLKMLCTLLTPTDGSAT